MDEPTTEPDITSTDISRRQRLLAWLKQRRRAVVTTAAVIVVLSTAAIAIPQMFPDAERLVANYLAALEDGDAEKALDIAGNGDPQLPLSTTPGASESDLASDALLTDAAIGTGWTTESVYAISGDTVIATIAYGDRLVRGKFPTRYEDETGRYLSQPFAYLEVTRYLNIDGASVEIPQSKPARLPIFPGAHRFYGDSELVQSDEAGQTMLAVPGAEPIDSASLSLTPQGEKVAADQAQQYLEECAESTTPIPPGCPFQIGTSADLPDLKTSARRYHNYENLRWEFKSYPDYKFTMEGDKIIGDIVAQGELIATADTDEGEVTIRCTTGPIVGTLTGEKSIFFESSADALGIRLDQPPVKLECA